MASSIPVIHEESGMPIGTSKRCKISIFQPSHYGLNPQFQEIMLHKEDFPGLEPGDIVELYHPENEEDGEIKVPRVLQMISKSSIYPDNNLPKPLNRDTLNVEKSVAETFSLPNYMDVIVTKVDKRSVTLDSVELTFKEQYVGRSEMWRLSKSLRDSCVYVNKKVDLCQGQVRCTVNELWSQGDRVSSGIVTNETKIVFRSPTAMVYLFIQMSSEMWQYDNHGELFFEKACGFLDQLFDKWEKKGSSHEVTIVLFSRCFYEAKKIEEFPERMRECLQMGYNNCFYEDFYRVVVQNERFDDWSPTVRQLKKIFTEYKDYILQYHSEEESDLIPPRPFISSASQGNFLEVLNISLNTFEHHYLNRNLDRTGQQSIVITPGVGIFEVDRELTMITKQRIIDSGVGSDLICVGEQPLHAVPLFKYHHKDDVNVTDDYSMPHWINLSFYSKNSKVGYSKYKSRINVPHQDSITQMRDNLAPFMNIMDQQSQLLGANDNQLDVYAQAERYDETVFDLPKPENNFKRKMSDPELSLMNSPGGAGPSADYYDPEGAVGYSNTGVMSPGSDTTGAVFSSSWDDSNIASYMEKARKGSLSAESAKADKSFIGSIDTTFDHQAIKKFLLRPGRALINPFDPSQTTLRLTSNRRRWTHIFPKGPTGQYQQLHHQHEELSEILQQISQGNHQTSQANFSQNGDFSHQKIYSPNSVDMSLDQVWNSVSVPQTGVDWKSLTIPASLPITTDYFPDPTSLVTDYFVNEYELVPEEILNDAQSERSPLESKLPLPTNEEIFSELISQRLAQGFQLILLTPAQEEQIAIQTSTSSTPNTPVVQANSSRSFTSKLKLKKSVNSTPNKKLSMVLPQIPQAPVAEIWLSIGRIFHRLSLSANKSTIKVSRYRPRQPLKDMTIHYRYRFGAPDNDNYEVSWVEFRTEKLENFNWNHMDFYVCTRGDIREFVLTESLKYWRFRLVAIPLNLYVKFNKKIMEPKQDFCDIYDVHLENSRSDLQKGFLRLVETCLNRIKKPISSIAVNKKLMPSRAASTAGATPSGGLREQRANTISIDRAQMLQQKKRHPSGGQGSMGLLSGLGHLSPDNNKGSNSSMDQSGSFEAHYLSPGNALDTDEDSQRHNQVLNLTSTLVEIADLMKTGGLNFVNKIVQGMPPNTFLAFEAVQWIQDHVEGVKTEAVAMRILQNMQEKRIICHASGNTAQVFVNGFYFFYLKQPNTKESVPYGGSLDHFRNDFVEVEFPVKSSNDSNLDKPEFLHGTMSRFFARQRKKESLQSKQFYKSVTLDVDQPKKSDRREWGHLKYQYYYEPTEAFDIAIQWSVASGATISDLMHTWARKAQSFGFSLMPVPSDPFALPITKNSDPVRGPIFIHLNTDCLKKDNEQGLFEGFPETTREQRLFLFREEIAHRFGFINSATDRSQQPSSSLFSTDHQYVHCTGNMFLLIPTNMKNQTGIQGMKNRQSLAGFEPGSSLKKEDAKPTLSRHLSQTKPTYDHSETGFLWSWNFMISRRWKMTSNTGATGEIAFMDKMLADFRAFCRNDGDRLRHFWESCMQKCTENEAVENVHLSDHC